MLLSRLTSGEYFEYNIIDNNSVTIIFEDSVYTVFIGIIKSTILKYDINIKHINTEFDISDETYQYIIKYSIDNGKKFDTNLNVFDILKNISIINRKHKLKRLLSC